MLDQLIYLAWIVSEKPFGSVIDFVAAFSTPVVASYLQSNQVSLGYFSYDWNLNSYANSGPPVAYT